VTAFSRAEVKEALERLRKDVLVWRLVSGRVDKWEHRLKSRWHLDDAGLALLTLLMLRGPQTPGELRARSERLHAFADSAAVEQCLHSLSEGENALVRELQRQPGQRENRWRHLMLHPSSETDVHADAPSAASGHSAELEFGAVPGQTGHGSAAGQIAPAPVASDRLTVLEQQVEQLQERLASLEAQLGVAPAGSD
jgi:uncharacterized protein YceH (UPF0502 family)